MRIFISSTYLDMKPYREALIGLLRQAGLPDLHIMENFPTSDKDAVTLSLDQLRESDVYIGIFGHRYGYVPDADPEFCSITRREYKEALRLSKDPKRTMHLLIYLAGDSIGYAGPLAEDTRHRDAQRAFRSELQSKHTVSIFDDQATLLAKVFGDLILLEKTPSTPQPRRGIKLFDENDEELIYSDFDDRPDEQLQAIERCLDFVAGEFSHLFSLNPSDAHPLLQKLRNQLRQTVPGILLDNETGVLTRTGVRHVVLRASTFQVLVKSIAVERTLQDVGAEIGRGAANDLVANMIGKRQLVPKSADALIALWSFWDRTGGWGLLRLVRSDHEEPIDAAQSATGKRPSAGAPQWMLRLDSNSLEMQARGHPGIDESETHRIANFWCGYISGFLDTALRSMTELISGLPELDRQNITWPIYHRVKSVDHSRIMDGEREADMFGVHFEEEQLSNARRWLARSKKQLEEDDVWASMESTQLAVRRASEASGPAFHELLQGLRDEEARKQLNEIIHGEVKSYLATRPNAEEWLKAATSLIMNLSLKLEP